MIEPPKATKGRRMSKKTRKKSAKTSIGKAPRGQSTPLAKTPPSKARPATASKKAAKQPKKTVATALHKPPSKPLKSPPAGKTELSAQKPVLTEGARAPAFRLPRDGGGTVALSDYAGKILVLFFYPRADTPGCTREAIDFTRLAAAFAENHTTVLGVSADSPKAQEAFKDKHELTVPLVSDEKHAMLEAYGVWGEKSMYGRTFQGIVRTTVVIGGDGRVIRIWRNVKVDGHADSVLEVVRSL
jgi:peroxiredoxin Q/BCP